MSLQSTTASFANKATWSSRCRNPLICLPQRKMLASLERLVYDILCNGMVNNNYYICGCGQLMYNTVMAVNNYVCGCGQVMNYWTMLAVCILLKLWCTKLWMITNMLNLSPDGQLGSYEHFLWYVSGMHINHSLLCTCTTRKWRRRRSPFHFLCLGWRLSRGVEKKQDSVWLSIMRGGYTWVRG